MSRFIYLGLILVACCEARAQSLNPTQHLIKQLQSKNADERSAALTALTDLGPVASPAVSALVDVLAKFDEHDRILAAFALGRIGKAAVPAVEKLLDHEDETTRYFAVWTISLIGEDANGLTPRLLNVLAKDEDEGVGVKTVYALARIAPKSEDVVNVLAKLAKNKSTRKAVRVSAAEELRHFGVHALAPLRDLFADEEVSWFATDSFNHLLNENKNDVFARRAWPHVAEILSDPYLYVSFDFPGGGLIFVISAHGEELLPSLEKKLADKNPRTRKQAVWALGQIASNLAGAKSNPDLVKKAIKLLLPYFQSPDVEVRRMVASIAPWHPDTERAFEGLMLDEVFPYAKSNVSHQDGSDLIKRWMDRYDAAKPDEKLKLAFSFELWEHDKHVLNLVWANVHHKDPAMRHRIACWLAEDRQDPGKIKKLVVPVLLESLKSDKVERRLQAANALSRVASHGPYLKPGEDLGDQTPMILEALGDPSPDVRLALLGALSPRTEGDIKRTLKLLTPLVDHPDADVRWRVVSILALIGKDAVPLLATIVRKEKDAHVLEHACDWLALKCEDAEDAVPALLKRAEQEEFWAASSYALFCIAPDRSFPGLLAILEKRDEALCRTIVYPPGVHDNPARLVDALVDDWKKSDLRQSQAILHTLLRIQPLLSEKYHNTLVYRTVPLISEQLNRVRKALTSKRTQDRRDAVAVLPLLKKMRALQPKYPEDWKKRLEFQSSAEQQFARMDDLLLKACADEDLQVRRLARRAYSEKVQPVFPGGYSQPFRFLREWWLPSPRQEFSPRVVAWPPA